MDIKDYFPEPICSAVSHLNIKKTREIRLYAGAPVRVYQDKMYFLSKDGLSENPEIFASFELLQKTLGIMSRGSLYSEQEKLCAGFLSLEGGHRVGICGKAFTEKEKINSIYEISSLNLRIAHEILGAADEVMPLLYSLPNTLIISPPGGGKTTLLRDVARQLSQRGVRVAICDERGEIAAMQKGQPSLCVGPCTDVFTGPKVLGMNMLLRAMAPEVLITDEIGSFEDAECIKRLIKCGVSVICSLHGKSREDAIHSAVGELILDKTFERIIVLGKTPGKIERIY